MAALLSETRLSRTPQGGQSKLIHMMEEVI